MNERKIKELDDDYYAYVVAVAVGVVADSQ